MRQALTLVEEELCRHRRSTCKDSKPSAMFKFLCYTIARGLLDTAPDELALQECRHR